MTLTKKDIQAEQTRIIMWIIIGVIVLIFLLFGIREFMPIQKLYFP